MQPVLNLAEGEPVVVVVVAVAVKKGECLEEDALVLDVGVVENALILGERGAVVMVDFFLSLMMVRIERGTFLSLLLEEEEEEC
jgi:hypothetical protein